jgi:putative ABC transport system substrate-binding protein
MSYAPDQIAMCRPAAWLVDNILKGTMPGEIPVEQPTTLALRINRKVADALGLMFRYGLLSVIERIMSPFDAVDGSSTGTRGHRRGCC